MQRKKLFFNTLSAAKLLDSNNGHADTAHYTASHLKTSTNNVCIVS